MCIRDRIHERHEGIAADTNPLIVDLGVCVFPNLERLGIAKIDSNGLDDPHGQIVNLFDSFSVRNFIQGNIWHQRWMVDYRGVYPRSTARRAAPFADLFWLPSDHSQDRGRLLSGS